LGGETRHVSVESVCSGEGLVSVFECLLSEDGEEAPGWLAEARGTGGAPAQISVHAIDGNDERAGRALELMVSVYGAEAGNLALVTMATAGIYVGGGIAPKILSVIEDGTFMDAFCAKGRLESLLADIPVRVILNDLTALYGAALHAASHEPARSS
jgi:glucokinase